MSCLPSNRLDIAALDIFSSSGAEGLIPIPAFLTTAIALAGIAFLASISAGLRGELPAQPFVERVLVDLALEDTASAMER